MGILQSMSSPSSDVHSRLATPHGAFGSSVQKRTKAVLFSFDNNDVLIMAAETRRLRIPIFLFFYSYLSLRIFCEYSCRCNFEQSLSMAAPTRSLTPEQYHAALQTLLNGPAGLPPAGVIPNLENPLQNLASIFHVTAALTLSFTTFAVAIRIYTKRCLLRSMGYEDCRS